MDDNSELRQGLKVEFAEFLEQDFGRETGEGKYAKRVDGIVKLYPTTKRVRLEVDLQDLSDYSEDLHRRVLNTPGDCLPAFQDALESIIRDKDPKVHTMLSFFLAASAAAARLLAPAPSILSPTSPP